jgi:hypothetical protein
MWITVCKKLLTVRKKLLTVRKKLLKVRKKLLTVGKKLLTVGKKLLKVRKILHIHNLCKGNTDFLTVGFSDGQQFFLPRRKPCRLISA